MAAFEVFIQPVIQAEGCRLVSEADSSLPRISLEAGVSWQDALRRFLAQVLGEVPFSIDLKELETVKHGQCQRLVIHAGCYLPRKTPVSGGGWRWYEPGSEAARVVEGAEIDPDCEVELFTDGGSRGNPGPAGVGGLLRQKSSGYEEEFSRFIGRATNNEAEYMALIVGLQRALERGVRRIVHLSDSQLIVRQIQGTYKVKAPEMQKLFSEVKNLIKGFALFRTRHIPRQENSQADKLAKQATKQPENGEQ